MKAEYIPTEDKAVVKVDQNNIPSEITILPLDSQVAFPTLNMSLGVSLRATSLVETSKKGCLIGVVGTKGQTDSVPLPGQVYEIGTVVQILYVTRAPDNSLLLIVQGLKRFRITEWIPGKDFLRAKIMLIPELIENDSETEALHRTTLELTQEIFSLSLNIQTMPSMVWHESKTRCI